MKFWYKSFGKGAYFLMISVSHVIISKYLFVPFFRWYFTMISITGVFAVTFSVVFAYVADVTTDEDRSAAYGLVSATFAASLVTSPAIGAYLGRMYSENFVIALATTVALLDIFFILAAVPESLPEKVRPASWGSQISWEKADPFGVSIKSSTCF
jgi:predicted MFS family arabinose efflux permease